jgi:hypothetical protein
MGRGSNPRAGTNSIYIVLMCKTFKNFFNANNVKPNAYLE